MNEHVAVLKAHDMHLEHQLSSVSHEGEVYEHEDCKVP